ncbi:MAG: hypothetical protein M3Q50_03695, partial [Chloroflexota bacterium]|nr:hypothetical protein [Chloroflexota bacterium]
MDESDHDMFLHGIGLAWQRRSESEPERSELWFTQVNGPAVRVIFVLTCAIATLHGCTQASVDQGGISVLDSLEGTPRWIDTAPAAPVWSPDGEVIAWGTEDGLYVSPGKSSDPELLTTEISVAGRPAWSPDGRRLVFVDEIRSSLVVIDSASGHRTLELELASDRAKFPSIGTLTFGGPAWSPDGSQIAFNCWDGAGDELCVVRADGGNERQVTQIDPARSTSGAPEQGFSAAPANVGPASWSPDGSYLAVAAYPEQRGAASGVFIVDLERGSARRVSSLVPNSEILWFGDGDSLLFTASEKGRSDAWRCWLESSVLENLTMGLESGAREPALAPDESQIAVSSRGKIIVQSLEGVVKAAMDSHHYGRFPAWKPNGDGLAFAAEPDVV